MNYLLSIIIPTKDRYKYLKILIEMLKDFQLEKTEVIIQDNTANNQEILTFVENLNWNDLKYYHSEEQIPISLNTDLAIKNSSGEYVCFIGDDDGVLSNIVDTVEWMKKNEIEALQSAKLIYNWPDYLDFKNMGISGALIHNNFDSDFVFLDPIKELKKLAKTGFKHIYTIPRLYQGIVKRSFLEQLYQIGETYTPGPSPDMATAVALSFVISKFAVVNYPVIITGQSKTVGGGERKLKGSVKNIEDVPFLPKKAKEDWNEKIPRVWCSQTVWPESAIKALEYMKKENEIVINYNYILSWFTHTHPEHSDLAHSLYSNKLIELRYRIFFFIQKIEKALLWRVKKIIYPKFRSGNASNFHKNINTIKEASDIIILKYPSFFNTHKN